MTAQKKQPTGRAEVLAMEIEAQYAAWRQGAQQGDTTFLDTRLHTIAIMIDEYAAAAPATAKQRDDLLVACRKAEAFIRTVLQLRDYPLSECDTYQAIRAAISAVETHSETTQT